MERVHEAVNRLALDLVKKLNVTPEDSDTSRTLSKNADDKLTKLGKLKGAAFDKAYVANEVAYRNAADGALEEQSIPSAKNAELKRSAADRLKILRS
jgi:putative membrane protein